MPGASRLNQSLGEGDTDDADHEFADARSANSGGDFVFAVRGAGAGRGVFAGSADGGGSGRMEGAECVACFITGNKAVGQCVPYEFSTDHLKGDCLAPRSMCKNLCIRFESCYS